MKVKLHNGIEMPLLGFGVYQISDATECEHSLSDALETGYRLIDTASAYQNEQSVGNAIKNSGIAREEIFVTTKLWIQDKGYEGTKRAFEKSLKNLQLDYLDLYLIHQPYGDVYGEWRAMQELYQEGKIKAIGVSNFLPDRMMDFIINQDIAPLVYQIETHPFHQQTETQNFLKENDVQIQAWGPFAEGRNNIFSNQLLQDIGNKYDKTIAQVVIRWLLQRGVSAIPKSVRLERIKENFNVFDFSLSDADMNLIKNLDNRESLFFDHRDPAMVKRLASYRL